MLLRKFLLVSLLISACVALNAAGQGLVYKLLYSPPSLNMPGGYTTAMFEIEPGVFYVLANLSKATIGSGIAVYTNCPAQ